MDETDIVSATFLAAERKCPRAIMAPLELRSRAMQSGFQYQPNAREGVRMRLFEPYDHFIMKAAIHASELAVIAIHLMCRNRCCHVS